MPGISGCQCASLGWTKPWCWNISWSGMLDKSARPKALPITSCYCVKSRYRLKSHNVHCPSSDVTDNTLSLCLENYTEVMLFVCHGKCWIGLAEDSFRKSHTATAPLSAPVTSKWEAWRDLFQSATFISEASALQWSLLCRISRASHTSTTPPARAVISTYDWVGLHWISSIEHSVLLFAEVVLLPLDIHRPSLVGCHRYNSPLQSPEANTPCLTGLQSMP